MNDETQRIYAKKLRTPNSYESDDSPLFALDHQTYLSLRNRVSQLSGAEHSHSTTELAGLLADMLACIRDELSNLDILIANASIQEIRLSSRADNVETERQSVNGWFGFQGFEDETTINATIPSGSPNSTQKIPPPVAYIAIGGGAFIILFMASIFLCKRPKTSHRHHKHHTDATFHILFQDVKIQTQQKDDYMPFGL